MVRDVSSRTSAHDADDGPDPQGIGDELMTQVFADESAATVGMIARGGRTPVPVVPVQGIPVQGIPGPGIPGQGGPEPRDAGASEPGGQPADPPSRSSPALTPGKGVRPVRCVGCCQDTLPRPDDGAPLCARCSEILAQAEPGPLAALAGPFSGWSVRWLRRRDDAELD